MGLALAAVASGCADRVGLSAAERAHLDGLDAAGIVRAYFSSGDSETELYLSAPAQRRLRQAPKYVGNSERVAGVQNLVVEGGKPAHGSIVGAEDWVDLRQFVVKYTSRRTNSIGEPPGRRFLFVYAGRSPETGLWKIVSVGTGP